MTIKSISRAALTTLLVAGVAMPAIAQEKSKGAEKKKTEKTVVVTNKGAVVTNKGAVVTNKGAVVANKGAVVSDKKTAKRADKAARKRVTSSQAVIVTREVLLSNGYQIVNVIPSGTTQVIYYRRGNRGNGRGLGPVERIHIVPAGDIVRFQSVPDPLLSTILRRLGLV
ncbi:MAG: hypothetical protein ABIR92_01000 [Gemmatimonadaceae bacterium]